MPDQSTEWLGLVEISGPFLTAKVVNEAFPQGLELPPRERIAELRLAWRELADDPTLHGRWVRWVLRDLLELGPMLRDAADLPSGLKYRDAGSGATVVPDFAVVDQRNDRPRLLVRTENAGTVLSEAREVDGWRATPVDRMAALLRAADVPVGLVTDGADWVLVWARSGETTGTCQWNVDYWLEERPTLDAFWSLLSARRFFAVVEDDELERLLTRSADAQADVSDQLGRQVRRAVELLVQELARRDSDQRGELLDDVAPDELYRAAVTVAMRLVFLLVAEERQLLPLDKEAYGRNYAASTLRDQLQERANRDGEQPLEGSYAAWHRLLALFRAVHGGLDHLDVHLPAYGGGLFDPDRYPFLEGRSPDTNWRTTGARPVRISDRTVLHVLDAIQVLRPTGRGTRSAVPVRLSFRALDVEQIGHVYEGLLDHTAVRSTDAALGLRGRKSRDGDVEPELALDELEAAEAEGHGALRKYLVEHTKLTAAKIEEALDESADEQRVARLRTSCRNDEQLFQRALPYLGLIRDDLRGYPLVFLPGEAYVTDGLDRRSSGTHYTPRAMAEEVVQHTLDAIVHNPGPQEDADPSTWRLKTVDELLNLKVCDIAMGSGAFLVAACRYLAVQLQRAWDRLGDGEWTVIGRPSSEHPDEPRLPKFQEERDQLALRLVAERCLYGVDVNPMAVEMAKVSLWLVTLASNRPFSFLDHALRVGDSLLGTTSPTQLRALSVDPEAGRNRGLRTLWAEAAGPERSLAEAREIREELERFPVNDVVDAARKHRLHGRARVLTEDLRLVGDLIAGAGLRHGPSASVALGESADSVRTLLDPGAGDVARGHARTSLEHQASTWLDVEREGGATARSPFHWPVEFPEVGARGGFDAIVGNPPFMGGTYISGTFGTAYREHLIDDVARGIRAARTDLSAYFVLRAWRLLSRDGSVGLVTTNSIAQGDTRETGLDQIVAQGGTLYRAVSSEPWPGVASLAIAKIWFTGTSWAPTRRLDGEVAQGIGADLWPQSRVDGQPERLEAMRGTFGFEGWKPASQGFVLGPEMAEALLARDPRNAHVVKPYFSGDDLNQSASGQPSRYVIDFQDWPLERAADFPSCLAHVERHVKPERMRSARAAHRDRWWQFGEVRPGLRRAISGLEQVTVLSFVSKWVQPELVETGPVFSYALAVFTRDNNETFGVLSSGFHWWWAVRRSSTLEDRVRYALTDAFGTFPVPMGATRIDSLGAELAQHRAAMRVERQESLTATYNRYHDPGDHAEDIDGLRQIHVQLDHEVRDAYGWSDLELGHDFHETRLGVRFTFEPIVRQEILDRLLELNHARYADEVRRGRHGAATLRSSRRSTPTDVMNLEL